MHENPVKLNGTFLWEFSRGLDGALQGKRGFQEGNGARVGGGFLIALPRPGFCASGGGGGLQGGPVLLLCSSSQRPRARGL